MPNSNLEWADFSALFPYKCALALSLFTCLSLGCSSDGANAQTGGSGGSSTNTGGTPNASGGASNATGGSIASTGGSAAGGSAPSGGSTSVSGGVGQGGSVQVGGTSGGSGTGGAIGTSGGSAGAAGQSQQGGSAGAPGSGGNSGGSGGGGAAGAGGTSGAGGSSGSGGGGSGGAGPKACGSAKAALSGITGSEGLVIGPDGTLYFSQPFSGANANFLGRIKPSATQAEAKWVDMKGTAFGITLDPKRGALYAGSRTLKKILKVTLTEPPVVSSLADAEATVNGVTLGEDAAVYYTDQGSGQVYRVTPEGAKTQVTTTPVSDANGIAFGPDGALYVLNYGAAKVVRLTLSTDHKESARADFATISGGRDADGIAFDAQGQVYVTASGLFRLSADGKTQSKLTCAAGGANLDFGVGALSCTDLYSASELSRCESGAAGMDVPWHRN